MKAELFLWVDNISPPRITSTGDMLKAVIYARVSKEDLNPENQIILLRDFAKRHGIEIVDEYVEQASGYETRPEDREAWARAVDVAKENNALIIVVSLDRIARRYEYLVKTLDSLREQNVQVISLQEPWLQALATIPDQTLRKFIYDVIVRALAYSYQQYVESIREKTRAGQMRAKMMGKHIGRPPAITDRELERYLAKYRALGLSLKAVWKIAVADGYKISYKRFLDRARMLRKKKQGLV